MKKLLITLTAVMLLSVSMSMVAYAAEWKQDTTGWWYEQDGGGYATGWRWIDGDNDGISEAYYFDKSGYLIVNDVVPYAKDEIESLQTRVNENGAYIDKNGTVVTIGVKKELESPIIYEFTKKEEYDSNNKNDKNSKYEQELKRMKKQLNDWLNSFNDLNASKVLEEGYTKGVSNTAIYLSNHSRIENSMKYVEESAFILKGEQFPTVTTYVKYKDMPYIVSYSNLNPEAEERQVEDISLDRNIILPDFTDPYSLHKTEDYLKTKGFPTIMGGVEFYNDPVFGYLRISFWGSSDTYCRVGDENKLRVVMR